jgi:hypothetical protein
MNFVSCSGSHILYISEKSRCRLAVYSRYFLPVLCGSAVNLLLFKRQTANDFFLSAFIRVYRRLKKPVGRISRKVQMIYADDLCCVLYPGYFIHTPGRRVRLHQVQNGGPAHAGLLCESVPVIAQTNH